MMAGVLEISGLRGANAVGENRKSWFRAFWAVWEAGKAVVRSMKIAVVKGMPTGLFAGGRKGKWSGGLRFRRRIGRADFGWELRYGPAQLASYLSGAHLVAAEYFGVAVRERHRERECQQEDEADGGQSPVGHK